MNELEIKLIGDLPIYVSMDSSDVWANKELFMFDKNYNPKLVAGVPPDYFSKTGQLWGNPLYNYKKMKEDNYHWWIQRIMNIGKYCDVVRIDHFRGFEAYYTIPSASRRRLSLRSTRRRWVRLSPERFIRYGRRRSWCVTMRITTSYCPRASRYLTTSTARAMPSRLL